MSTLTSANSVVALSIANLYNTPQIMQGYAADDAFAADEVAPTEAVMGVDGKLSAGWTPQPTQLHIMLQADSVSNQIFDDWYAAQKSSRDVYVASGTIALSGTNQKYTMRKGYLTSYTPMPGNKKILQPRKYVITFEEMSAAPF
jgi:hypothetical protein